MSNIKQRITLVPRHIFQENKSKCFVSFFSGLELVFDRIDNDENVKNCCEEVSLISSKITIAKNQTINEFHESCLNRIENRNSHFLIFNN